MSLIIVRRRTSCIISRAGCNNVTSTRLRRIVTDCRRTQCTYVRTPRCDGKEEFFFRRTFLNLSYSSTLILEKLNDVPSRLKNDLSTGFCHLPSENVVDVYRNLGKQPRSFSIRICNLDYYPFEKTRRAIIKSSLSVAASSPFEMSEL